MGKRNQEINANKPLDRPENKRLVVGLYDPPHFMCRYSAMHKISYIGSGRPWGCLPLFRGRLEECNIWIEGNMLLVKEANQWWDITKIRTLKGYAGVCDNCGTPIEYPDEFQAAIVQELYNKDVLYSLTRFHCPSCLLPIRFFNCWRSLDISSELNMLNKEAKE